MKINREGGFTLLELMMVGVIITILAAIVMPRMDFIFSKDELRSSTTTVTSSLYLARMKAVNDGAMYGVQFDENGTIQVVSNPMSTQDALGPQNHIEDGVIFGEITFADYLVVFNEFGQLDPSCIEGTGAYTGYIYMYNDIGDSTRVEVTMVTGRIRETNL